MYDLHICSPPNGRRRHRVGYTFSINPSSGLVSYTAPGCSTPDEFRAFLDGVLRHPGHRAGFAFLGDHASVADPGTPFIRAAAQELKHRSVALGSCRWAVVAPTPVCFGMTRMWAILTDGCGVEIQPFPSVGAAREWAIHIVRSLSEAEVALDHMEQQGSEGSEIRILGESLFVARGRVE